MIPVLVSLGANLGNSHATINSAAQHLLDLFGSHNVKLSTLLSCPAIGGPGGQDDFHNAVAAVDYDGSVFDFWHNLRVIEAELGRQRRHRWESRRIDLDILMFDDLRLWTPHLKLPHPRMVTRSFAILPAAELLPNAIEPVSGMELQELARRLPYRRQADEGSLLIRDSLQESYPSKVLVLCLGQALYQDMVCSELCTDSSRFHYQFVLIDNDISQNKLEALLNSIVSPEVSLVVLAIACPDPTLVAWEDYTRRWAQWMGFEQSNRGQIQLDCKVPKYLLNCFDLNWAMHELKAAVSAMNCELNVAVPGWTLNDEHE